jgi:adenylate cyclase
MPTVFTFAAGVLAVLLSMTLRSPWTRLGSFVAVVAGAITAALVSFNYAATYLPMVAPMSEFIFTMLLGLLCDFAAERVEKTQLRRTFERYVSRDIVREMLSRPGAYMQSLGGMSKPVAVLFSDIRSYSAVTSTSRPDTLVAQLNEYFTAMVECVFECGGTLDKFIGDAVMAVWGTLKSAGPRQDAASAVRAALLMQKKLVNLNESWSQRGWPRLRIGIAINYGEVVVGNIGSPHRMEFTVIGETVNVSWKLQELTKRLNESLIIGASVAPLVNEHFETRFLGQFQLSGIDHPTEVFTVAEALRDTAPNIAANKFLAATSLPMAQPQITPPAGVSAELVTPSSTAEAR